MAHIESVNKKSHFSLMQIYFYLTEGCNLACKHCWLSPKYQNGKNIFPSLPLNTIKSIIEQGKHLGLTDVKLTGGEPLMHPDIINILKYFQSDRKINLSIETNGILCTPEIAREIALCHNPFVSVSLDGADELKHEWVRGIKGCYNATIDGIKNLVNVNIKPQIIFTIMRHNQDQIDTIIRLAESLKVSSVKINLVQPSGRGEKLKEEGNSLTVKELLDIGYYVENILTPSTSLKLYYDQPLAFRPLSKMLGDNGRDCSSCTILQILGVLSDGSYALCGIGSKIQKLKFGDAAIDSLEDVWENSKILNELRDGIPKRFQGVCKNCHMKKMCNASCIAQNFHRTGNLWGSFWFCQEAYDQGLFPITRLIEKTSKTDCNLREE